MCIRDRLKEYSYLLHTIKEDSTYLLSDDVEDVLSKMNISGGEAWANLQEYLTSIVEVEYKEMCIRDSSSAEVNTA